MSPTPVQPPRTVLAMVQEPLPLSLRPHMETDHQDHSSERFQGSGWVSCTGSSSPTLNYSLAWPARSHLKLVAHSDSPGHPSSGPYPLCP